MSLEPLDDLNRPFRIKDSTFSEIKYEEFKANAAALGKDKKEGEVADRPGQGGSLAPASLDIRMMLRFVDQIDSRPNNIFKEYLITLHESMAKVHYEMGNVSSLKCMADRSLTVKPRDDQTTKRLEMEAYYTFASIMKKLHKDYFKKVLGKDKLNKEFFEKYAGLLYRLIFKKAYQITNTTYDKYLRGFLQIIFCCRWRKVKYVNTLWDKVAVSPVSPYAKFDHSHSIWRDYQTNERGDRGLFRSMDRIKLLHNMLLDSINIYELQSVDIIEGLLPLHDRFMLKGKLKEPLFEDFPDIKNHYDPKDIAENKGKIMGLLTGLADAADSSDFIDISLKKRLELKLFSPTEIDVEAIQNYYGEKIALYFEFLIYHTKSLRRISLFGAAIFTVDMLMVYMIKFEEDPKKKFDRNNITVHDIAIIVFKMNRLAIAVATVVWSSFYLELWKRKQQFFAIKYGMTEFENTENKRPNFTGEYMRDLATSSFNFIHYNGMKRLGITLLTYFCVIVLVLVSVVISGLCILLRKYLAKLEDPGPIVVYFVPALINYISYKLIEYLFSKLAMFFNLKENHETLTKFEDSLINKVFTFNFFNAFNSFLIIGFVKYIQHYIRRDLIFGECTNTKEFYRKHMPCYEELQGQVFSFFIMAFLFNFFEMFGPVFYNCFKKKFVSIPKKYAWGKIDDIIESEFKKGEFMASPEVDGVLHEYSEVTLQFASLSFFGMVFPLAFLSSFFTSVFEIHIDKFFYMNYIRRPIPRSAADIGSWQYILEAISFFTIFVNSALVCFTINSFFEVDQLMFGAHGEYFDLFSMQMKYFVLVVFVLLFIKLLLGVMIIDIPENLKLILSRHKNIISRTIKRPRESNANGKSGFPIHPHPGQIGMITDLKKNQVPKANDDDDQFEPEGEGQEGEEVAKSENLNNSHAHQHFSIAKEINYDPKNDFNVD